MMKQNSLDLCCYVQVIFLFQNIFALCITIVVQHRVTSERIHCISLGYVGHFVAVPGNRDYGAIN